MPIYEYRCRKGHTFEVMQRFSDDPITTCEVCGAPVERVYHPVAVHFKGSGFYNTDYGTRKRAREMKDAKEGAKSETTKSDSTSSDTSTSSSPSSDASSSTKGDSKKSDSSSTKASKGK